MTDVFVDALLDTVKLIPFLFVTYLAMEYLEHHAGEKSQKLIQGAGKFGPVVGGLLGIVPQCGFSAAASNLYAGRVITLGTLMAIYLSTSDEMLPILISEQAPVALIFKILAAKALIGIAFGLLIDFVLRRIGKGESEHIHDLCEREHCGCEHGIAKSALIHTLQISFFLLVISIALNAILALLGEDALGNLILNRKILGPMVAGLVGLIPNCAGSVVITQLYLKGAMGVGAAMSGLLTGSGVGLLVLLRVNENRMENAKIVGLLYVIGILCGMLIGCFL